KRAAEVRDSVSSFSTSDTFRDRRSLQTTMTGGNWTLRIQSDDDQGREVQLAPVVVGETVLVTARGDDDGQGAWFNGTHWGSGGEPPLAYFETLRVGRNREGAHFFKGD